MCAFEMPVYMSEAFPVNFDFQISKNQNLFYPGRAAIRLSGFHLLKVLSFNV